MTIKVHHDGHLLRASFVSTTCIDATNAAALKAALPSDIVAGKNLLLSLAGIQTIDSAGIGALVTVLKTMRKTGGRMALAGVNQQIKSVLEVIRLTTMFEIFEDEAAASNALAASSKPR